jgi:hypothetical protein
MHLNFHALTFLLCAAVPALVSSCSTESIQQLQEKEDKKTQAYENYEEKLEIREEARDQRYNAWFNRVMN